MNASALDARRLSKAVLFLTAYFLNLNSAILRRPQPRETLEFILLILSCVVLPATVVYAGIVLA